MTNSNGNTDHDGTWLDQLTGVTKDGVFLIQQELKLARQETVEKLRPAAVSTGLIAGGGLMTAVGGAYVLNSVVQMLSTIMPRWLASLLSGLGFTIGGMALMRIGTRQLKELDVAPQKTLNSLREDKEWLLTQIKSRLT
jgi:hypothetical protein